MGRPDAMEIPVRKETMGHLERMEAQGEMEKLARKERKATLVATVTREKMARRGNEEIPVSEERKERKETRATQVRMACQVVTGILVRMARMVCKGNPEFPAGTA